MRCKCQPSFLEKRNTKIQNILEVRIEPNVWNNIILAKKKYKITYSWVVRYCALRLAKKKSLRKRKNLDILNKKIQNRRPETKICHRHLLCLYGTDEILLRNAAMILGVTLSQLIRIALELYLGQFIRTIKYAEFIKDKKKQEKYNKILNKIKIRPNNYILSELKKYCISQYGSYYKRILDIEKIFWDGIKLTKSNQYQVIFQNKTPINLIHSFKLFTSKEYINIRKDSIFS